MVFQSEWFYLGRGRSLGPALRYRFGSISTTNSAVGPLTTERKERQRPASPTGHKEGKDPRELLYRIDFCFG